MNLPNGWGSARRARRGIRWWKRRPHRHHRYGSRAVCGSGFADGGTGKQVGAQAKPVSLDEIELSDTDRTRTGFAELDRVLGSGVVRGSLVLVGGDPGIGKSTLLLQVCRNLAGQEQKVLYVSGEESLKQIKLRASRIGTQSGPLSFLSETNLDTIAEVIREVRPDVVVIDSIRPCLSRRQVLHRAVSAR